MHTLKERVLLVIIPHFNPKDSVVPSFLNVLPFYFFIGLWSGLSGPGVKGFNSTKYGLTGSTTIGLPPPKAKTGRLLLNLGDLWQGFHYSNLVKGWENLARFKVPFGHTELVISGGIVHIGRPGDKSFCRYKFLGERRVGTSPVGSFQLLAPY